MFEKLACEYLERGIAVIPIKPKSKVPAMAGWQSKLIMDDEVDQYRGCGISLLCGFTTKELPYGIVALDWDKVLVHPDGREFNAHEYQDYLEREYGVPRSPVHKIGKKGLTQFYLGSSDHKTVRSPGMFDFLARGSHTILPPSIHETGIAYRWTSRDSLTSIDLNDLPTISNKIVENLLGRVSVPKGTAVSGGRNNALYVALAGMFGEGTTDLGVLTTRIYEFDLQQHPENPYFSDMSEPQNQSKDPRENALQFVLVRYKDLVAKNIREQKPVELFTVNRFVESLEPEPKQVEVNQKNNDMEYPDGPLGEVARLINECGPRLQPNFALNSAIHLFGLVIANKYAFKKSHPNIYSLNIGASGTGKEAPIRMISEVLKQAGLGKLIGFSGFRSAEAFEDAINKAPVRIDCNSEAGSLLGAIFSDKTNPVAMKLEGVMRDAWSKAGGIFLNSTARSVGMRDHVVSPQAFFVGATNPEEFKERLTDARAISGGLFARFLFFFGNDYIIRNPNIKDNHQKIISYLQELISVREEFKNDHYEYREIHCTDKLYNDLADECIAYTNTLPKNSKERTLSTRRFEQATKLVLINACAKNPSIPTVTRADFEWALKLMDATNDGVLNLFQNNGKSLTSILQNYLINIRHGRLVTLTEITEHIHSVNNTIKGRDIRYELQQWVNDDIAECVKVAGKTKPITMYCVKKKS